MTVHFIGAGPGAADLLTLRGAELLRTSPVCLYAGTYIEQVLAHCPEDGERIDTQHLNLDAITEHLVRAHREGKDVARLCSVDLLGDRRADPPPGRGWGSLGHHTWSTGLCCSGLSGREGTHSPGGGPDGDSDARPEGLDGNAGD